MLTPDKLIFVAVFTITMGAGIALIWAIDILRGKFKGMGGFFAWKNEQGESLWTHITAELITALLLISGGVGLLFATGWGHLMTVFALGALVYTSLNSLGWAMAQKHRYPYAIPMSIGLAGGLACLIILLL